MNEGIYRIPFEPTRWFVPSASRKDYAFIVDSDYHGQWACGCEQGFVNGGWCRHIGLVMDGIMSKTKFPRQLAIAVAAELCPLLKPATTRMIVAGSLRRRKAEVGDIEILYVPIVEQRQDPHELLPKMVPVNLADEVFAEWLRLGIIVKRASKTGAEPWGAKNKFAVHVASGIPVDLFAATEDNWFNYLVCRTGSADNNTAICNAAIAKGWHWKPYGAGFTDAHGDLQRVAREQDVFALAGLPYKEPWER